MHTHIYYNAYKCNQARIYECLHMDNISILSYTLDYRIARLIVLVTFLQLARVHCSTFEKYESIRFIITQIIAHHSREFYYSQSYTI